MLLDQVLQKYEPSPVPKPISKEESKESIQKPTNSTPIKSRKAKKQSQNTQDSQTSQIELKKTFSKRIGEELGQIERIEYCFFEVIQWFEQKSEEETIPDKLFQQLQTEILLGQKNDILNDIKIDDLSRILQILSFEEKKIEKYYDCEDIFKKIEEKMIHIERILQCTSLSILLFQSNISKDIISSEFFDIILDILKFFFRKYLLKETSEEKTKPFIKTMICQILNSLSIIILNFKLKDEFISTLIDLTLQSIFKENMSEIQIYSLKILPLIYSKYQNQRDYILLEIISQVLKLSNSKWIKSYKTEGVSIHIFTALILLLIQSSIIMNPKTESFTKILTFEDSQSLSEYGSQNLEITEDLIKNYVEEANNYSKTFCEKLIERCLIPGIDGDNKQIILNFIDDLLNVLYLPLYPASDLLLVTIGNIFCFTYLNDKNQTDKNRSLALDVIGKIGNIIKSNKISNFETLFDDDHQEEEEEEMIQTKSNKESPTKIYKKEMDSIYQLDSIDKSRVEIFGYLSTRSEENNSFFIARQFSISQWIMEEQDEQRKCSLFLDLWKKNVNELYGKKITKIYKEEIEKLYIFLISKRKMGICNQFETILKNIVVVLDDPKINVRTKAVKSLTMIIDKDPRLLEIPVIQNAIKERSDDESIKVRESIIELIGSTMMKNTKLIPTYLSMIIQRVKDIGTSVRKRSISILGELCPELNDIMITEICVAMSHRLNPNLDENESIKKMICDIFEDLWFKKKGKNMNNSLQIIDVISQRDIDFKDIKNHWLIQLIQSLKSKDTFPNIISSLVKNILTIENSDLIEGTGRNSIPNTMRTLHLFCITNPQLLSSHLQTLSKYLSEQYSLKENIVFDVASIFSLSISTMPKPDLNFEKQFFTKLLTLLFKSGIYPDALLECANCLCIFSKKTGNYSFLIKSFCNSFKILKEKKENFSNLNQKEFDTLSRLLTVIGLYCRCFDFDDLSIKLDFSEVKTDLKQGNIFKNVCYMSLYLWNHTDNIRLKQSSISTLGHLFIKSPLLFFEKEPKKIIEYCLSQESPLQFKKQILNIFKDFLIQEELKFEKAKFEKQLDTGVTNSIIPEYFDRIIQNIFHSDSLVRYEALNVIEISIRQGLIIPAKSIPFTIAMEVDPDSRISEKAHQLNIYLESRYHNDLVHKSAEGIILSFKFLKNLLGKSPNGEKDSKSILTNFYQIIKEFTNVEKNSIIDHVLKELLSKSHKDLDLLIYLIQILSFLQFTSWTEVLQIIYKINSFLDLEADTLKSEIKEKGNQKSLIQSSICILFILEFKKHIIHSYGITKNKLEDYDPSSVSKYKEKMNSYREIQSFFNFDKIITMFHSNEYDEIYQEFKRLLKEQNNEIFETKKRKERKKKRDESPKKKETLKNSKRKHNQEEEEEITPPKKQQKKRKWNNEDSDYEE